ncbi:hypothetical protein D3C81_1554890 [compost metagenome]
MQANGFFAQHLGIVPVSAKRIGAVVQTAVRRVQKLTDAGSDLGCVGCVGLERRIDQGLTLHLVSDVEAVAQRRQDRYQHEEKNQPSQVDGPVAGSLHNATRFEDGMVRVISGGRNFRSMNRCVVVG